MGAHGENPFQQIRSFINEMEQYVADEAKRFGADHLSGPQGFVLMHLVKHPDQVFSIKDFEDCLNLSKSVTSNLIKRMEKNGFVLVVPSAKDKRVKHVLLTDYGREQSVKLEGFLGHVHKVMLQGIRKEDAAVAKQVFQQLKANIRAEQDQKVQD
ncbi:MarR family winged helix-turn-helix transcriptional regulator [Streptococcus caprae]|uniref:MarR family winged helix-turn-helix transcriptional regulator n=1 Tax=Streptococcus caprae TaxID=1640501 RepID=A0ABV8CWZ1_9STRE